MTGPAPFEGLDRSNLPGHLVEFVHRGGWVKADLQVVEWQGRRAVLKDFASKSLPTRLIGWLQTSRELRAYRRLSGVGGVPRFYRRLDRHAFLMEEIRGRLLPRFRQREVQQRRLLLGQLREILDAVHAAGVVHNDARGQDNALVSEEGKVTLVDFAGAICLTPGGLAHRLVFRFLVRVDEAAFLKWKAVMLPEELTPMERGKLRRYSRWRRLWFLNPKGWGKAPAVVEASELEPRRNRDTEADRGR